MAKQYWLLKSEPSTYSWDHFVSLGRDHWDGVRNYQARNNLKAMKEGDLAFFYHSVGPRDVVGICQVVREYYPDPTDSSGQWVVVDVVPVSSINKPVTLATIKATEALKNIALVKQSRLSVVPLSKAEFDCILQLGETPLPQNI